jgi:dinuclear metal center YbgI/SA1388 family protein
MLTVADFAAYLNTFAPLSLAAEWDNVGLLLGDSASPVTRVMTCLTITPEVVVEAIEHDVQLIVSHHPVLFKAVKKLTTHSAEGLLLLPLLKHNIAVYSPHTAFDNCIGGINDGLAARLGLTHIRPLRPRPAGKAFKLVVFVPVAALSQVSEAVFAAGAGVIGAYRECSFRSPGTGTFFGTESTNPAVGQKGVREEVAEERLEVVVPEGKISAVVSAMRAAHPYEEVAFDIYPLHTLPNGGEGRIGELAEAVSLRELAAKLPRDILQVVGSPEARISRVAVACGAAGEYLSDAIRAGADAFVTGELRFHDGLTAQAAGVAVLVPGHYATERPAIEDLATRLAIEFPTVPVFASRTERDPFMALS